MQVKRIDLYDFKVTLSKSEFNEICDVCDLDNTPLDVVLRSVIEKGFDVLRNGETGKD